MKRDVLKSIVQQCCDSQSKKSLIHRHSTSVLVVIFSECDDANFFMNTNERGKLKKTDFNFDFAKISVLSFAS